MAKFILILFLLFESALLWGSNEDFYRRIIEVLASDSLEGRGVGSSGERKAADFIAQEFSLIKGCRTKKQSFSFVQDSTKIKSQNVIGFINNHAAKTILISAHYDHIGFGGELSMSQGVNAVHNGADDNASGVALMLSLAHELSVKKDGFNYIFLAYSAHEIGLFGSAYFFSKSKKYQKRLKLCLNFDMMGRMQNNHVYVDGSEEFLNQLVEKSQKDVVFKKSTFDRINGLDSKWFYQDGIPSLTFSTGRHLDYHRITDDIEYINFEGLEKIDSILYHWIMTLN